MDDYGSQSVELYIYDMTQGMAAMMSPLFLGKFFTFIGAINILIIFATHEGRQIDGIWHTAVVVFGREYFYGSGGITSCSPVSNIFSCPLKLHS